MSIDTNRDRVRLLVGDTAESDPLLYDDEIDSHLDYRSYVESTGGTIVNIPAAAADAAGAIAAKFSREFNFAEDGQRFDRAQKVGHYMALEQSLRRRSGGVSAPTGGTAVLTST